MFEKLVGLIGKMRLTCVDESINKITKTLVYNESIPIIFRSRFYYSFENIGYCNQFVSYCNVNVKKTRSVFRCLRLNRFIFSDFQLRGLTMGVYRVSW